MQISPLILFGRHSSLEKQNLNSTLTLSFYLWHIFSHKRKKYNKNVFFSASEENETNPTTVTVLSHRRPILIFLFLLGTIEEL